MKKCYYWEVKSNDGCYEERSNKYFATTGECYNDMRNAVLEKMKWNTEYDEDLTDGSVQYSVEFTRTMIIHKSFSGTYTYMIRKSDDIMYQTDEHNAKLVAKINELWATNRYLFQPILCALYERDIEKFCRSEYAYALPEDEKSALHNLKTYWAGYADTYLEHIADDTDLECIIKYVGK